MHFVDEIDRDRLEYISKKLQGVSGKQEAFLLGFALCAEGLHLLDQKGKEPQFSVDLKTGQLELFQKSG